MALFYNFFMFEPFISWIRTVSIADQCTCVSRHMLITDPGKLPCFNCQFSLPVTIIPPSPLFLGVFGLKRENADGGVSTNLLDNPTGCPVQSSQPLGCAFLQAQVSRPYHMKFHPMRLLWSLLFSALFFSISAAVIKCVASPIRRPEHLWWRTA